MRTHILEDILVLYPPLATEDVSGVVEVSGQYYA